MSEWLSKGVVSNRGSEQQVEVEKWDEKKSAGELNCRGNILLLFCCNLAKSTKPPAVSR